MRDDRSITVLVGAARGGDKVAWDEIVERYAPLLWSICRRYRLADHDCEDVVQNVWLLLVRHLTDLREPAALPGWLATTMTRECLKLLRIKEAHWNVDAGGERAPLAEPNEPSIEDLVLEKERHAALLVALDGLPEECRRLLTLLAHDPPLSYVEIGARLGMKVGGIGPRRGRCLDKLRRSPVLARLLDQTRTASENGD